MAHTSPERQNAPVGSGSLEVRLLGVVDFDSAMALQEWLAFELSERNDTQGMLLLCEHPPLITIGREGSRGQILLSDAELEARQIDVRWIGRGGGAVMHVPGQLAMYPILPLQRLGLGIADFRDRLDAAVMAVCRQLRIPAKRLPDASGIWSRGGQVARFGASLTGGVTLHGAWLDVCSEPGFLNVLSPIRDARAGSPRPRAGSTGEAVCESRMTSLQAQLVRRIPMNAARAAAIEHIAAAFDYTTVHTYTGHPHLKRTRRRICVRA